MKHYLGSPDWVIEAKRILGEMVEEYSERLGDTRFSFSETFTNIPPAGETGSWAGVIENGKIVYVEPPLLDADLYFVADYAACIPVALARYTGADEAFMAKVQAHREHHIAAGDVKGYRAPAKHPPVLQELLIKMHDRLADATIARPGDDRLWEN